MTPDLHNPVLFFLHCRATHPYIKGVDVRQSSCNTCQTAAVPQASDLERPDAAESDQRSPDARIENLQASASLAFRANNAGIIGHNAPRGCRIYRHRRDVLERNFTAFGRKISAVELNCFSCGVEKCLAILECLNKSSIAARYGRC
jgi:hypothetical protein